jgi:hypothetical protein
MADLPHSGEVPHRIDNVVRRFSLRFVDHKRAIVRRRHRLSRHEV